MLDHIRQLELPLDDHRSFEASNDNHQTAWEAKFNAFHAENPHIYELVKKFTFEVIATGRKHYGMTSIINRIRWYTMVETTGDRFKINNNFYPYYARLFMREHPEHSGFFRTRALGRRGANKNA